MISQFTLIARQPIFDREVRVSAYEILFRGTNEHEAVFSSAEHATAEVAVHALMDVGLDQLVGDRQAWINIPREVLVGGTFEFLPADRVVLELLENTEADAEVLEAIRRAKSLGYKIALDDFVLSERTAALVPLADFVKLDVLSIGAENLPERISELRRPQLRLLAEKVESHEMFALAARSGCELLQGYFFARPQLIESRNVPNNRMSLLRVVGMLQDTNVSLEDVEVLVRSDIGLSYRLLRYVNSAAIGVVSPITSLRHAVMTLGLDRVRVCVLVLLLTANDDKPDELVTISLVRARYCQLLCSFHHIDPQRGFLVGLLSAIDAFLDRKLDEIVAEMGLSEDVARALTAREGELGLVLEAAIACESADWERMGGMQYGALALRETYMSALSWSAEMRTSLLSP
jgi:EAL and modified HD-GYP domain-containing signal transduction protein